VRMVRSAFSHSALSAFKSVKCVFPCLLAIPVFDRIAGLYNRHLNSNRGICLR
jgi:hypothetical protein